MAYACVPSDRSLLKTPQTRAHYGMEGYYGFMFDVVCLCDGVTIHAVHAVAHPACPGPSTVYTVNGGYDGNGYHREAWTYQCAAQVASTPSRLEFRTPEVLKGGGRLGIYIATTKPYSTGVALDNQSIGIGNTDIELCHGIILLSATHFAEERVAGNYSFIGAVEYRPGAGSRDELSKAAQAALSELANDLDAQCLNDEFADMTLVLGTSRLPVHGSLLAARSSVFRAMLKHPMREQTTREIQLEGFEETTVKLMLRFIYSGKVDPNALIDVQSCLSLLQAANHYDIPSLVKCCAAALIDRLTVDSVADVLLAADDISCQLLKKECLDYIGRHGAEVQETGGFLDVVKRPTLVQEVFAAVCPKKRKT